jgi:hypothetical protein
MPLSDTGEHGVIEHSTDNKIARLRDDVVGVVLFDDELLLAEGVRLHDGQSV